MTLGDEDGLETSSYNSATTEDGSSSSQSSSSAFVLDASASVPSGINRQGIIRLYNPQGDGLQWFITGQIRNSSSSVANIIGEKALDKQITQLSVFTSSGNFDNGAVFVGIRT
jgi:hypothetical protein